MLRLTLLSTAALGTAALTLASCSINTFGDCISPEGSPERREISLTGDFSELVNDSSLDVDIRHGEVASVTIIAAPNLQEAILVKQSGGKLTLDTKSGCYTNTGWRAEIVTPGLREVYNDGSGEIEVQGLHGRDGALRLHADGSGNIDVNGLAAVSAVEVETGGSGDIELRSLPKLTSLQVACDGSGGVDLSGDSEVEQLRVYLDGSGGADLSDIRALRANVETDGSGSADITVVEELVAQTGGSGSIHYRGEPAVLKVSEDGSGRVKQRGR